MTLQAWLLLAVMFSLTGSSALLYYWAKRAGQFDDVESAKYRMLQDENQEG
ncbi:cbb3-type cytochrome oxidase assembly protein CcoS [Effusibacillus lacus]|uniref:Cytochrome oxidase maturation protein, cbb3-type n=1 Tax=Effusibacillus lacus TaxID=1348429 RepID=A0A292YPH6_9BACL|nr:cbb3-type cytochrome oxidase assembly protein CcoS [Effusibacillus lacus]TCS70087.1 cbb3-type cytochrome oxidase maturation protein [Effusibacillus lacus]GAX91076.1 cytochrome oxidase maturation protein, cbb3-type [Effusibacillus lacus]